MRGTASALTPLFGPIPAVRSKSNALDRPTLRPPPVSCPRLHLRRSPEPSQLSFLSLRRLMFPLSASATSSGAGGSFAELTSAADFAAVASPGGRISVIGFGSLLSERSARSTFPELEGFRVAALRGFRRVFAHAAPIFFERGIAVEATKLFVWRPKGRKSCCIEQNQGLLKHGDRLLLPLLSMIMEESKEFSSLSVEQCEGEMIVVTVFEIKEEEVPAFIEREIEFRFLAVVPEGLDGVPFRNPAVICSCYSDEDYFQVRCKGSKEIYNQHYGRYGIDKIWRDDILLCRLYLRHCVLAAKNLGEPTYSNFLDHTYLGDRKTTIREYLATTGAGIMEEG